MNHNNSTVIKDLHYIKSYAHPATKTTRQDVRISGISCPAIFNKFSNTSPVDQSVSLLFYGFF